MQTSIGEIDLTKPEREMLERLAAGTASMEEAQRFYGEIVARGYSFPIDWELYVLRATVATLPGRDDLIARLAVVQEMIGRERSDYDLAARLAFARSWARFANIDLVRGDAAERRQRCAQAIDDASTLLASAVFDEQTLSRRVDMIVAIHNTLMSVPSPDLPIVADLGLRRFRSMLHDSQLTEPQVCTVFDALHSMYFAGVSDVRDLRRFDAIVPLLEDWWERRVGRHVAPSMAADGRSLRIAYLLHTAHLMRGNAVAPLIISLAEMHATHPNRSVVLYLVQHVDPMLAEELRSRGLTIRVFPQSQPYSHLEDISASLRADKIDVVITEQNRAIATALFIRRVARRQIWLDTGFPFWSLKALDWTISPTLERGSNVRPQTSPISWRQSAASLKAAVDKQAVTRVRGAFPHDAFVLGVFARLIKLNRDYLEFLGRLLRANSRFHLLIAGPGDTQLVESFASRTDMSGRITYIQGTVDLNIYGPAIDAMCDTFPFIGGNACREVAVHGTPVIAKLGTPWDAILRADRNPDLLADTEDAYIAIALRLAEDSAFRERQKEIALAKGQEYTEPSKAISDVEAAIAEAIVFHDLRRLAAPTEQAS